MHRLVEISFADLDIGDYFSYGRGRPRDIPVYQKTGEYPYKLVRNPPEYFNGQSVALELTCFPVLWRMPPWKHNHL